MKIPQMGALFCIVLSLSACVPNLSPTAVPPEKYEAPRFSISPTLTVTVAPTATLQPSPTAGQPAKVESFEAADGEPAPALAWKQEGESCLRVRVYEQKMQYGPCQGEWKNAPPLSPQRLEELEELTHTFKPFRSSQPGGGEVLLNSMGQRVANRSEQRGMAYWANEVYMEAVSRQKGPLEPPTLTWKRDGGLAGVCDELKVIADGWAVAKNCKTGSPQAEVKVRLKPAQMDQLFTWYDTLEEATISTEDAAKADGLKVNLTFNGQGKQKPNDAQKQELLTFAQDVYQAMVAK